MINNSISVNQYSMNRIEKLFRERTGNILSVYFTAGYPVAGATTDIIRDLQESGADMVEIGIPFSDPLADGPVIQMSNRESLNNGMNISLLFKQLENIRKDVSIPVILMGYVNPVLKFGIENFCHRCAETGIDGVILPDLPPEIFIEEYSDIFNSYNLFNIFLISPQTDDDRIRFIDSISRGFIYMVSSSSTTGRSAPFSEEQLSYFRRIRLMNLKTPRLTGFGISDNRSFNEACSESNGAIIGSAFIKMLSEKGASGNSIRSFIDLIRGNSLN